MHHLPTIIYTVWDWKIKSCNDAKSKRNGCDQVRNRYERNDIELKISFEQ